MAISDLDKIEQWKKHGGRLFETPCGLVFYNESIPTVMYDPIGRHKQKRLEDECLAKVGKDLPCSCVLSFGAW